MIFGVSGTKPTVRNREVLKKRLDCISIFISYFKIPLLI